jgi:hypothetical protein
VTVPAGGSVLVTPPPGFTPTDFVIIRTVVGGVNVGGFTVFDPPTATVSKTIQVPCPASGTQVWGFQFFGATDYGPIFANAPMTLNGFDSNGFPNVELARTDANGNPVVNTSGGHCFPGTGTTVLADPATRTVRPEFEIKSNNHVCLELTFTDVTATSADEAGGASQ